MSINPLSASIKVGEHVVFSSTVTGGIPPYSCQWYLNGNPVLGATSSIWVFMPTISGTYYVYIKVTDANSNMVQSPDASIEVAARLVGGYSVAMSGYTVEKPLTSYLALIAILMTLFTVIKRKARRSNCSPKAIEKTSRSFIKQFQEYSTKRTLFLTEFFN